MYNSGIQFSLPYALPVGNFSAIWVRPSTYTVGSIAFFKLLSVLFTLIIHWTSGIIFLFLPLKNLSLSFTLYVVLSQKRKCSQSVVFKKRIYHSSRSLCVETVLKERKRPNAQWSFYGKVQPVIDLVVDKIKCGQKLFGTEGFRWFLQLRIGLNDNDNSKYVGSMGFCYF